MSTVDKLISNAKQKLNVLINAVSKMELTPEIRTNANKFYHQVLARVMRESYQDDVVLEGGMFKVARKEKKYVTILLIIVDLGVSY